MKLRRTFLRCFLLLSCLSLTVLLVLELHFTDNLQARKLEGEKQGCRERRAMIFAKTHKTGSTTLQNILFRFGQQHNLLFLLPKSGKHTFHLRSHFRKSMADLYENVR